MIAKLFKGSALVVVGALVALGGLLAANMFGLNPFEASRSTGVSPCC